MSVEKKETLIQVQNLTKTFGGSVHALNGVSTDIKKGEVVCVIGPSGSGSWHNQWQPPESLLSVWFFLCLSHIRWNGPGGGRG